MHALWVRVRFPCAQSKWGRHCCRPHSHRRVGIMSWTSLRQAGLPSVSRRTWQPMSMTVRGQSSIPRSKSPVFRRAPKGTLPRLASSPALAPASGVRSPKVLRLHLAEALLGRSACFSRSRDCSLWWLSISDGRFPVALPAPSIANQARSLSRRQYFALASNDPSCVWPKLSA